jgi:hypothetical protein
MREQYGRLLPESEADFVQLKAEGKLKYEKCDLCGQGFSASNTKTAAGWRETQISDTCETCFDKLYEED